VEPHGVDATGVRTRDQAIAVSAGSPTVGSAGARATLKSPPHKLTRVMIDRLEKEVDMLERHLQVLRMVIENEPIGIVKMSNETGYPHHKVRYSLRVLEEENLIEPSSQGAITTESTQEFVDDLDDKVDVIVEQLQDMKIEDLEVEA
jgi:predicted transcriptional regulator